MNKTCRECRNFKSIRCGHSEASHPVCCAFKPKMTLFDRITASPEVLAPKFVYDYTPNPPAASGATKLFRSLLTGKNYYTEPEAVQANLNWLNAPAESE